MSVSVSSTGVVLARLRYPREEHAPQCCYWRTNLTGLSQTSNFYYVAYRGQLYVFEPSFPTQSVSAIPSLIIDTPPSRPGLRGYLDTRQPRGINNLVVDFLGTEEVLALVRDDGDVEAYRTRHIEAAIVRRRQSDNTIGRYAFDIKPFFHRNVGLSAWGLAIHTNARIIAVSSNTHNFDIFAFALVNEDGEFDGIDAAEQEEEQELAPPSLPRSTADRKDDRHFRIKNGQTNIPNIAFCNTGDDPQGRWLLTIDIHGVARSWDLQQPRCNGHQAVKIGSGLLHDIPIEASSQFYHQLDAGWGIMFLDHRSFRRAVNLKDALGLRIDTSLAIWDTSKSVMRIKDAQVYHPSTESQEHFPPLQGDFGSATDGRSASGGPPLLEEVLVVLGDSTITPAELSTAEVGQEEVSYETDEEVNGEDVNDEGVRDDELNDEEYNEEQQEEEGPLYDDDNDEDLNALRVAHLQFYNSSDSLCSDLLCPILTLSAYNIALLQPTPGPPTTESHLPIIQLARALEQPNLPPHDVLRQFQRLCMHAYIPSLGVVVVGSQDGRVAILSLVCFPHDVDISILRNPSQQQRSIKETKMVYAFTLEHILPWPLQEKRGYRPHMPLHGLAVGPVQGTEDLPDEMKRWRLLVMYQDHSVLSYEIGKKTGAGESGVDVRDVMI